LSGCKEGINKGYWLRVLVFIKREREGSIYKEGERVVDTSCQKTQLSMRWEAISFQI